MTPTSHHHDEHLYDDEFLHNEDVAHEHTDVAIRPLLLYLGVLIFTCVVSAVIVYGLMRFFESQAAKNEPQLSPLAVPAGQEPPQPRLVTNEPAVLQKHRDMESEALQKYGWVDKPGGTARLPIAEAKKKLLHDGLPTRADGPEEAWLGTYSAARGESSGGRSIPMRKPAPAAGLTPEPPKPVAAPAKGH